MLKSAMQINFSETQLREALMVLTNIVTWLQPPKYDQPLVKILV